jgi:hypothetical protein
VHHHFAVAASSGVSSPASSASAQRSTKVRAIWTSPCSSASVKRLFWKEPIVWPNALR